MMCKIYLLTINEHWLFVSIYFGSFTRLTYILHIEDDEGNLIIVWVQRPAANQSVTIGTKLKRLVIKHVSSTEDSKDTVFSKTLKLCSYGVKSILFANLWCLCCSFKWDLFVTCVIWRNRWDVLLWYRCCSCLKKVQFQPSNGLDIGSATFTLLHLQHGNPFRERRKDLREKRIL